MKTKIYAAFIALIVTCTMHIQCHAEGIPPKEALQRLIKGNQRFVNNQMKACDVAQAKREATSESQRPFAVILGCADSRIAPELIFDQSFGDVFVIRVAGNVVGPLGADSIDYSVLVNHSSLVVVLGHENCGAVKAVLENNTKDITNIADLIAPAIKRVQEEKPSNLVESAIKANVKSVVDTLVSADPIKRFVQEGKLAVVGAYYRMRTGEVEFLPDTMSNIKK